jgi:purine-nucleoside phosphorylase
MNYTDLEKMAKSVLSKAYFGVRPSVAIVLGTGLGALTDKIVVEARVQYSEIKGMPVSTVQGHNGAFVFGWINDIPVVVMEGRVHYYEGYTMEQVVLSIRLMRLMGAEVLFLSNASGGINAEYRAGDLMVIKDHISSFVPSPLIGANIDELGVRFPDMSEVYDKELINIIDNTATSLDIGLRHGVYVQLGGPNFETPAEVDMLRGLGADAVGMSTAVEAMAAKHCGMRVCGISCVTNSSGSSDTHEEVQAAAARVEQSFVTLVRTSIINMKKQGVLNIEG